MYKKKLIFVTMNNIYHRDIVNILLPFGREGLKACSIAKRIYNLHADLFDERVNFDEIHRSIGVYLWKQSQKNESPFLRNAYGIYSIKPDIAIQLDLFWDSVIEEEEEENVVEETPANGKKYVQLELF